MIIGFACGIFDLYHAGHALMLKECSENCDYLILGLNEGLEMQQGKNKPVFSIEERKIILESIKYVNEIFVYKSESELTDFIGKRSIDIRFLGDDYKDNKITAPDLVKRIYFINRNHGYSTSIIRKRIVELGVL